MLKPHWNNKLEQWEVIDSNTGEITICWGHEGQENNLCECQAYCNNQNSIKMARWPSFKAITWGLLFSLPAWYIIIYVIFSLTGCASIRFEPLCIDRTTNRIEQCEVYRD